MGHLYIYITLERVDIFIFLLNFKGSFLGSFCNKSSTNSTLDPIESNDNGFNKLWSQNECETQMSSANVTCEIDF